MKNTYCLICLIAAIWLSAVGGCSEGPQVEFVKGNRKIDVMVGGNLFTSYLYEGKRYEPVAVNEKDGGFVAKPILFPVRSPSGIVLNRSCPLVKVEGETTDHPQHVGIFFTYDKVNDDSFWNNTNPSPQIKHVKVTEMAGGTGRGTLSTVMHWVGKSGQVLLEEKRNMVFLAGEDEYAIDFSIDLTAQDTKVVFGDTKEGMFALRVTEWFKENGGCGRFLSSNGDETEKNVWGRRARWVCLQGKRDGRPIGIAVLNHPSSVNYPTYWHARGYGLLSANPLGQYVFENTRNQKNPQPFNLTLEPAESAHFRFRMIIYEAVMTKEQLEERFEDFVKK